MYQASARRGVDGAAAPVAGAEDAPEHAEPHASTWHGHGQWPRLPMDAGGNQQWLPAALLAQYPALAQVNWSAPEMNSGMDDDISGRSSFDASDFDDGDDGGYVSGPGTGYGEGGMGQNFGDMGYASDFGGR